MEFVAIFLTVWVEDCAEHWRKCRVCKPMVINFREDELGTEASDEKQNHQHDTDPVYKMSSYNVQKI